MLPMACQILCVRFNLGLPFRLQHSIGVAGYTLLPRDSHPGRTVELVSTHQRCAMVKRPLGLAGCTRTRMEWGLRPPE